MAEEGPLSVLDLPPELLAEVLRRLEPLDLIHAGTTCKVLRELACQYPCVAGDLYVLFDGSDNASLDPIKATRLRAISYAELKTERPGIALITSVRNPTNPADDLTAFISRHLASYYSVRIGPLFCAGRGAFLETPAPDGGVWSPTAGICYSIMLAKILAGLQSPACEGPLLEWPGQLHVALPGPSASIGVLQELPWVVRRELYPPLQDKDDDVFRGLVRLAAGKPMTVNVEIGVLQSDPLSPAFEALASLPNLQRLSVGATTRALSDEDEGQENNVGPTGFLSALGSLTGLEVCGLNFVDFENGVTGLTKLRLFSWVSEDPLVGAYATSLRALSSLRRLTDMALGYVAAPSGLAPLSALNALTTLTSLALLLYSSSPTVDPLAPGGFLHDFGTGFPALTLPHVKVLGMTLHSIPDHGDWAIGRVGLENLAGIRSLTALTHLQIYFSTHMYDVDSTIVVPLEDTLALLPGGIRELRLEAESPSLQLQMGVGLRALTNLDRLSLFSAEGALIAFAGLPLTIASRKHINCKLGAGPQHIIWGDEISSAECRPFCNMFRDRCILGDIDKSAFPISDGGLHQPWLLPQYISSEAPQFVQVSVHAALHAVAMGVVQPQEGEGEDGAAEAEAGIVEAADAPPQEAGGDGAAAAAGPAAEPPGAQLGQFNPIANLPVPIGLPQSENAMAHMYEVIFGAVGAHHHAGLGHGHFAMPGLGAPAADVVVSESEPEGSGGSADGSEGEPAAVGEVNSPAAAAAAAVEFTAAAAEFAATAAGLTAAMGQGPAPGGSEGAAGAAGTAGPGPGD